ncbi:MAG: LysM peptidoglycan-binding domain-containing protein [Blautia sp.]|nr:LysM peptidoglycan-binding domain-containing protein [Blautia sp.]
MDDNFDIEINEAAPEQSNAVQLPMNFISFGEIENDDVKIYIKQDVYKALEKYALADTAHERGTIILGDYCEEMGKTHVVISNFIEARYTDASASTLTFTHETWDYVHKEQDAKYPDKKIVGWQHTHPSYGIFLSNYDLFIHENFFNLPFQVAYVIDPIQNLRGFFQWKNGKIEKLKGYYIYDDLGVPIKIEQAKKKTEEKAVVKSGKLPIILLVLLCISVVSFVAAFVSLSKQIQSQKEQQTVLEQIINEQNTSIINLQNEMRGNNIIVDDGTSVEDLLSLIENQQIKIDSQQEVIAQLQTLIDGKTENPDKTMLVFTSYTVQTGDTLAKICSRLGVDYSENRNLILSLNGIQDENIIYSGQSLLLPVKELN